MKLSPALWLVVDALAVYRLSRLVGKDLILERARERVARRSLPVLDFVTCGWCTSMWFAAGVVVLTRFEARWWVYPALVLALSAVAGILSEVVR